MRGFPELSVRTRCITGYWLGGGPMLRPGLGNGAEGEAKILQTPTHVVIMEASNNDTRIIPLDGRPHLARTTTQWFGDSRGRWDGNTLVVDTTNYNDQARSQVTTPMIRNMHLVERFTRVDADTLLYQFTVDDPTTWTKPWSGEVAWPRVQGPMYEAACHEGNYSTLNLLKGILFSRQAEAAKKAATK